jgi:uncharacterized heparinase superfamily protein
MRENPKTPARYARIIRHRFIMPRLWSMLTEKRTRELSDGEFMQLCGFTGTADEFIKQFHILAGLRFFFHPRNQTDSFLQLLAMSQPHEQILSEAQDVLENRFETLGSSKVHLDEKINWHRDFKSGKVWPLQKLTTDEILDRHHAVDIKVPWELSRFHQVWWLGKAYWVTRNEQYAKKFAELIGDWIEQNPLGKGPNWTTAMEVAIRACNWIAGYYFFCESLSLSPEFWVKFQKSLYAHGRFIESNLEYSWRNSNHLLSNVVGLIFLGNFFHQRSFGRKWLAWGVHQLEKEMEEQVYQDGVDYEKSTSYHRLVLELFYTATILSQRNNFRFPQAYLKRLERMFEFVQHYTRPDGSIPLIGDADDGRLFRLSMNEDMNDHRHALSVGAVLFERSDFVAAKDGFSQSVLWLFGEKGVENYRMLREKPAHLSSRAFSDGGFYILRSNEAHVFVDVGDLGMMGRGGHGHNDTLSFEVWIDGGPLIVDSGTYAYTFDVKSRNEFRSTRAHNTVVIDSAEITEFSGLWGVRADRTDPRVLEWNTSEQRDILVAEHRAYQSLSSPVTVQRRLELNKERFELLILDNLKGTGTHRIESFLHFAPHVSVELSSPRKAIARNRHQSYVITATVGEFTVEQTWFSRSYGVRERNQSLQMFWHGQLPLEIHMSIERG